MEARFALSVRALLHPLLHVLADEGLPTWINDCNPLCKCDFGRTLNGILLPEDLAPGMALIRQCNP